MNKKQIILPIILLSLLPMNAQGSYGWFTKIYNLSWTPLKLQPKDANIAKLDYDGKYVNLETQKHPNPVVVNKNEVVVPTTWFKEGKKIVSFPYRPDEPAFKTASFKYGWGPTIKATHNNKTTTIDKDGHWIFSDQGVFFTDKKNIPSFAK